MILTCRFTQIQLCFVIVTLLRLFIVHIYYTQLCSECTHTIVKVTTAHQHKLNPDRNNLTKYLHPYRKLLGILWHRTSMFLHPHTNVFTPTHQRFCSYTSMTLHLHINDVALAHQICTLSSIDIHPRTGDNCIHTSNFALSRQKQRHSCTHCICNQKPIKET